MNSFKNDNRFRKARTYNNWMHLDGLLLDKHYGGSPGCWHFFKDGDRVEFKENGKLVRRKVKVIEHTYDIFCHCPERIEERKAYVRFDGRRVRVTEAPAMRLLD